METFCWLCGVSSCKSTVITLNEELLFQFRASGIADFVGTFIEAVGSKLSDDERPLLDAQRFCDKCLTDLGELCIVYIQLQDLEKKLRECRDLCKTRLENSCQLGRRGNEGSLNSAIKERLLEQMKDGTFVDETNDFKDLIDFHDPSTDSTPAATDDVTPDLPTSKATTSALANSNCCRKRYFIVTEDGRAVSKAGRPLRKAALECLQSRFRKKKIASTSEAVKIETSRINLLGTTLDMEDKRAEGCVSKLTQHIEMQQLETEENVNSGVMHEDDVAGLTEDEGNNDEDDDGGIREPFKIIKSKSLQPLSECGRPLRKAAVEGLKKAKEIENELIVLDSDEDEECTAENTRKSDNRQEPEIIEDPNEDSVTVTVSIEPEPLFSKRGRLLKKVNVIGSHTRTRTNTKKVNKKKPEEISQRKGKDDSDSEPEFAKAYERLFKKKKSEGSKDIIPSWSVDEEKEARSSKVVTKRIHSGSKSTDREHVAHGSTAKVRMKTELVPSDSNHSQQIDYVGASKQYSCEEAPAELERKRMPRYSETEEPSVNNDNITHTYEIGVKCSHYNGDDSIEIDAESETTISVVELEGFWEEEPRGIVNQGEGKRTGCELDAKQIQVPQSAARLKELESGSELSEDESRSEDETSVCTSVDNRCSQDPKDPDFTLDEDLSQTLHLYGPKTIWEGSRKKRNDILQWRYRIVKEELRIKDCQVAVRPLIFFPYKRRKTFLCSYKGCKRASCDPTLLIDHIRSEHEGVFIPIKCNVCDEEFTTKEKLYVHRKKNHRKRRNIQCEYCGLTLDTLSRSAHHKWYHLDTPCRICAQSFEGVSSLRIHMKTEHRQEFLAQINSDERMCETCGKVFGNKSKLKGHLKTHNRDEYKCDKCDYISGSAEYLKVHRWNQHNPDPESLKVKCDVCHSIYKNEVSFRAHKNKICEKEKIYNIPCPMCGKMFSSNVAMKKHKEYKHDKIRYPCIICKRELGYPQNLRRHIRTCHKESGPTGPKKTATLSTHTMGAVNVHLPSSSDALHSTATTAMDCPDFQTFSELMFAPDSDVITPPQSVTGFHVNRNLKPTV